MDKIDLKADTITGLIIQINNLYGMDLGNAYEFLIKRGIIEDIKNREISKENLEDVFQEYLKVVKDFIDNIMAIRLTNELKQLEEVASSALKAMDDFKFHWSESNMLLKTLDREFSQEEIEILKNCKETVNLISKIANDYKIKERTDV